MLLMITTVKLVLMTVLVVMVVTGEVIDAVDDYNGKVGVDDSVGGHGGNRGGYRCC